MKVRWAFRAAMYRSTFIEAPVQEYLEARLVIWGFVRNHALSSVWRSERLVFAPRGIQQQDP